MATTIRLLRLRSDVDIPTFKQFGLASAVGGLAGAASQSQLASPLLTVVLAVLLVLAGSAELARRPLPLPPAPRWRLLGGVLSGLFGGLVGNQGGIRAAALLGFNLRPRQLVATATASALLVDAARVPIDLTDRGAHDSGGGATLDSREHWCDGWNVCRRTDAGTISSVDVSPTRGRAAAVARNRSLRCGRAHLLTTTVTSWDAHRPPSCASARMT